MAVILVGLSFSKIFISIGQFMMAGGWIVGWFDESAWIGRLKGRSVGSAAAVALPYAFLLLFKGIVAGFREFFRHRAAVLFASILLFHLIGLAWTTDFGYAMKDLRTKLPIFLLPLFLSTAEPLGKKGFYRFMLLFIMAVIVRSVANTWQITTHYYVDLREVSRNISHIIFSLLLALSIFSLLYFLFLRGFLAAWQKGLVCLALLWLCAYLILTQSLTGVAVVLTTLGVLVPVLVFRTRNRLMKAALAAVILLIPVVMAVVLQSYVRDFYHVNPVDLTRLDSVTSRGNRYINASYATETDNGNYLWIYIQWDELRAAWNKRSRIPFDSLNRKSSPVAYTVIRYLNSKGWRKDADAVERLKPEEIGAIERGVANCLFVKEFGLRGRIYEFLWGWDNYRTTGDPTGSTAMQRLEFWKASAGIIRQHWPGGVGTGDMNLAFNDQYKRMNTKLAPGQRWRSHNQFLSICVGFGVFGLIWFLAALFLPPAMLGRYGDYFFLVFITITTVSMLTGDTIESQTGVTFFALFFSLFLFARKEGDPVTMST